MTETANSSEYPLDEWIESVKQCNYLPEDALKKIVRYGKIFFT